MFKMMFVCVVIAMSAVTSAADPVLLGTGSQPCVASDGERRVAVVFGRPGEIAITTTADGGTTFSEPRTLARVQGMPLGMRRGPRIVVSTESMVVTAISGEKGNGKDGDVWAWLSTDDGKVWKRSTKHLNSVAGAAREGLHGMAANRAGTVACVWLDLRNAPKDRSGTEVWMNLSKDGGATWQGDRVVYRNPGGSVCECCHPSVALDEKNTVYVMFRHSRDGARDMYLTRSSDDGKTFDEPQKLGEGTWPLNGCPMDGGDIIVDANRDIETVWIRNGKVFSAVPGAKEIELSEGRQPVIVSTAKGVWKGWTNGTTLMGHWALMGAQRQGDDAKFPDATVVSAGNVAVVWEQKQKVFFNLIQPR